MCKKSTNKPGVIKTNGEFSTKIIIFPSNRELQARSGRSVLLNLGKADF